MKKLPVHFNSIFCISLILLLVLSSCTGLFNKRFHEEEDVPAPQNTPTRVIRLSASTTDKPKSASRSVWPVAGDGSEYAPDIKNFTDFTLITSAEVTGETSWGKYTSFSSASIILNPTISYTLQLSAKYKGGKWISAERHIPANAAYTSIEFTLKPSDPGSVKIQLDISEIADSAETIKAWVSDTLEINRRTSSELEIISKTDTSVTFHKDSIASGLHYAYLEILDTNNTSTIVGPETVYVFPGQTSTWTPSVTQLNTSYTINFALDDVLQAEWVQTVTTNYTQNIYTRSAPLPAAPTVKGIGYTLVGWTDGEEQFLFANDSAYIPGGTYDSDITLYSLWEITGIIDADADPEKIPCYFEKAVSDDEVETIPVIFESGISNAIWNATIEYASDDSTTKKTALDLTNIPNSMFRDACPEDGEPSTTTTLTRLAGTSEVSKTWLKTVVLPDTYVDIPDYAFYNQSALSLVNLPASLTVIGDSAFEGTAIETVALPKNVESIGVAAFANNSHLTKCTYAGTKFHKIPAKCFYNCTSFTTMTIGPSITYIDYDAFTGISENSTVSGSNIYAATWTELELNSDHNPISYTRITTVSTEIKTGKRLVRDFALDVNTKAEIYSFIEECNFLDSEIPLALCAGSFEWTTISDILKDIDDVCENAKGINLILTGLQIPITASVSQKTIPADFLMNKSWLSSITLPHSFSSSPYIECIGERAFAGCTNLKSVANLGGTVTIDSETSFYDGIISIGDDAFYDCSSLTGFTLPKTIETVGKNAFKNCTAATISLASGITDACWNSYDSTGNLIEFLSKDTIPTILKDGSGANRYLTTDTLNATNLVSAVEAVTNTADSYFELHYSGEVSTFEDFKPLQNLTVGADGATIGLDLSGVTITGTGAARALDNSFFSGYSKASYSSSTVIYNEAEADKPIGKVLKSIKLPQNLTNIYPNALACCPKLESVTIPESLTSTGSAAFCYNQNLKEVIFAENSEFQTLGSMTFAYTPSLTGIELPDSLKTISQQVFMESGLESITIPDNADFSSNGVFYNCKSLTTVVIGKSVTKMKLCFEGCENISSFTLKSDTNWYANTKVWGDGGYNSTIIKPDSKNLSGVDIQNSDFYNNTDLKTVLEDAVSDSVRSLTIKVPFNSWDELAPLANITTSSCAIDLSGATDNSEDKKIPDKFLYGKLCITSFSMPKNTKIIGKRAFASSNGYSGDTTAHPIRTFTFNEAITEIQDEAFLCNSLSGYVVIPDTVTTLGEKCFMGSEPMAPVITANSQLTEIPDYCFFNCKGAPTVNDDNPAQKIIIPTGCTRIGKNAFFGLTVDNRIDPIALADTTSSWKQYFETTDSSVSTEWINSQNNKIIEAADLPAALPLTEGSAGTTAYKVPYDNTSTYSWEKFGDYVITLANFSYAEGVSGVVTGNLDRFDESKGSYTLDTENNILTIKNANGIAQSEFKQYLRNIVVSYSGRVPLRPTGDKYNYTFTTTLPSVSAPGVNTLTEKLNVEASDLDLFKIVTYRIDLGTLGGTPVTFEQTVSSGWGIHEYTWEYTAERTTSYIEIIGYEGSALTETLDEFKNHFLKYTTAKDDMNLASVDLPSGDFQEANVKVTWGN